MLSALWFHWQLPDDLNSSLEEVLSTLRSLANPEDAAGMSRFGVGGEKTLGIRIPVLRKIGKAHRNDHQLAADLWATGIHEARILASMVEDPRQVYEEQMESWVNEFDAWDLCDQVCMNLFDKHPLAYQKAADDRNYVKKAISWALRQIGKFRPGLAGRSVDLAKKLAASDSGSARWIGKDALREFEKKGICL